MRSFPLEAVSRMVWDFLDREPSGVQMDGSLVEGRARLLWYRANLQPIKGCVVEGRGAVSGDPAEMRIWRRQLYLLSLVIPWFCLLLSDLSIQTLQAQCWDVAAAFLFFSAVVDWLGVS